VRIIEKDSDAFGVKATIWKIEKDVEFSRVFPRGMGYCVDIDGHGKFSSNGDEIAFPAHVLEPLVQPDELAWQQFRTHLKPNPAIIFDADPIVVSTDEEAERIADTVPNSHIIVAIYRNGRRIVLSEYYGRSQTNRP